MQEIWLVLGVLLAYGGLHSLLAAFGMKRLFLNIMGERAYLGLYRLFYNIVSTITLLPVFWVIYTQAGDTIWHVAAPWSLLLRAIQALGVVGLTLSLLQIDGSRFLGLPQAAAWWNGDSLPLPPENLQLAGVYNIVRHPLYTFSLMVIWPTPTMSAGWLGFAIGTTIYFTLGSILEEQKLRRTFGEAYVAYQSRVPWMIPFLKFNSRPTRLSSEQN